MLMNWRSQAGFLFVILLTAGIVLAADKQKEAETPADSEEQKPATSWVKPVPGFEPVQAGEHPRLLFRKSDLPALRKRAETPEGKAILARLRDTLGGGEEMPKIYNPSTHSYSSDSSSSPELKREGAYTIGHAAGFGFLYQLTGDKKYADLSRKCVELALKGQRDRDDRYSLIGYGNDAQLRAAPTLGTYAMAYDFCYDAWPEDFRKDFAEKLMTVNADIGDDLKSMALKPNHMPSSNHWGAEVGGVALTLLALNGDPGVDQKFIDKALPLAEKHLEGLFNHAWGDAGWFAESTGPSQVSSNSAIMPALQAFKVAMGKDYTDRPSIRWMTMRWAYDIFPKNGKPWYPCRLIAGNATYGTEDFLGGTKGGGISHGGWFSQGFGVIPEADKPALLWTYRNFVAKAMNDDYDIKNYPHRAVLSFLNWPIGMTEKNPEEVLPKVRYDSIHGYVSFRNQWKNDDDILITGWTCQGPRGWIGKSGPARPGMDHGNVFVWAYGAKANLGNIAGGRGTVVWSSPDGSGLFTNGTHWFAVDFSRRSGADALIVSNFLSTAQGMDARFWRITNKECKLGGKMYPVLSLGKTGIHPVPKLDKSGERILVGGQSIILKEGSIAFQPVEGVATGMGEKVVDANTPVAAAMKKREEEEKLNAIPRGEVVLPTDPPALSFTFDQVETENDKQVFHDGSPNKLIATVKGKPVTVEDGIIGNAVLLNGTDNVLVVAPNPAIDMAAKSVSISCWFKNASSDSGGEVVLLEKNVWQKGKTPDCYSLCIDSIDKFGFNTFSAGNHPRKPIPWTDGQWHHIASVFDASAKQITIYHNGKEVGMMTNLKGTCQIGEGSAPLAIGARGTVKPSNFFGCFLDELVMYDRPLTRGEVLALYEKGATAPADGKANPSP